MAPKAYVLDSFNRRRSAGPDDAREETSQDLGQGEQFDFDTHRARAIDAYKDVAPQYENFARAIRAILTECLATMKSGSTPSSHVARIQRASAERRQSPRTRSPSVQSTPNL